MAIVVKKVTEKNTKKQILEEFNNAIKLIKELEGEIKKQGASQKSIAVPKIKSGRAQSDKNIPVDMLIDKFNKFSNTLKNEMIIEIQFIDELRGEIDSRMNSIKNIYSSNPSVSLGKLILSYKNLIKEQDEKISRYKKSISEEIIKLKKDFEIEQTQKVEEIAIKESSFEKRVRRTEKSDTYIKKKSLYALEKDKRELIENNKSIIEDLKDEYEAKNRELYREVEEQIRVQKEIIEKADAQKENFDKLVNSKVNAILNKEKSVNAKEYKSLVDEYKNRIKLKTTQLNNLEVENDSLQSQIDKISAEIKTIQEKAHILASKTIDAKSSTESFKAMKDVAMEQAKSRK
jgi:hypothetical protein